MRQFSLIFFAVFLMATLAEASNRQSGKLIGQGTSKAEITLSEPKGGWTVNQMITVSGQVSDPTIDPILVNINGGRYLLRTFNGAFRRSFPVSSGKNTVVVQGSNKAGTVTEERSVFAQVNPVPIMVVLTSDTDGVYTDLHIYEPSAGLKDPITESQTKTEHVFWARTGSPSGGTFYLNQQGGSFDQPGYGPYLYTHKAPPLGIYRIDANYWPGGDKGHTIGTLNIVLNGGKPTEIKRSIKSPLAKPGETITMAFIRIDKGSNAFVYVPGNDPKPRDNEIWPEWVVNYKASQNSNSEDY